MKNNVVINLIFTILFASGNAFSAENTSYLCVVDEITGFYFKNSKWGQASFNPNEEKFIIRKLNDFEKGLRDKKYTYGLVDLGRENAHGSCIKYGADRIYCTFMGELHFSIKSGRFIKTYTGGYWDGIDNNKNTPHIQRGRCSKI